jgi:WD40 repeat protein
MHKDAVLFVAFSPDGQTLASASGWEVPDYTNKGDEVRNAGAGVWLLDLHAEPVRAPLRLPAAFSMAFSPDGKTLATGVSDVIKLKLYDVRTGKERASFPGHTHTVWSVAFSPDGKLLASGAGDTGRCDFGMCPPGKSRDSCRTRQPSYPWPFPPTAGC